MNTLTVYKASAGSGKTFQLVTAYLQLLLENPRNYRHILAVTFTNKATSEMKSRILEQLHGMAAGRPSPYLNKLMAELRLPEAETRKKARQVLKNILHDYNRFSISTIDAFTQRIIKAFNRETGISPYFALELNDDRMLEEATGRLLERVDSDKQLRRWLVEFSREKIMDNKSQRIEDDIRALGKELFKEQFQLFFPEDDAPVYTRENLEEFRKELSKIIATYESTLRKKAGEAMEAIHGAGFSTHDFAHKSTGVAGWLEKIANGKMPDRVGARVTAAAGDPGKWLVKNHPHEKALTALVEKELLPRLTEILDYLEKNNTTYYTAVEVRKQLRMLGILTDLKTEVYALAREKGVLQLSGANLLLSRIIGETDSPFIYEKIGNQYRHFMLDEFQDTSLLQWNNFKPLVANALAEGHDNLLVGDVKQSVYRWRNSDWSILAEQIHADFPHFKPRVETLQKNWRSRRNIIDFNSEVFEKLKAAFETVLAAETGDDDAFREKFSRLYTGFRQSPGHPDAPAEGRVEITFEDAEDFTGKASARLVEQVKALQDRGLKASDMAILIRTKKEGPPIIETFLEASRQPENAGYNLSVISNESLFLKASRGVNFVMLVMEAVTDPENQVTRAALLELWRSWLKPELKNNQNRINWPWFRDRSGTGIEDEKDPPEFPGDPVLYPDGDFNGLFEAELEPLLEKVRETVFLAAPDESIMQVCRLAGLFDIPSEWPFLQTLIDQAAELKANHSNDLSNLLHWWEEEGKEVAVNANEQMEAIWLLTVHKAKGLEFEAVLIPDFNWDVGNGRHTPLLWCRPTQPPFNRFPLLPVKAVNAMEKTIFQQDYYEETVNSFIDTLNLIYVAFTRAKSVLLVQAINPPPTTKSTKKVNILLKKALQQLAGIPAFADAFNEAQTVFTSGKLPAFAPSAPAGDQGQLQAYHFSDFTSRIRLRVNSEDFLSPDAPGRSVKNTGKLIHEILSGVETRHDIDAACDKAFNEGKINEAETSAIRKKLKVLLDLPETKPWFDGSYRVMNERELLAPDRILRPDRIMVSGKKAVVVDYKWGEKIPGKYHAQVGRYAEKLRETGFDSVEGYIWYLNRDEIEKV